MRAWSSALFIVALSAMGAACSSSAKTTSESPTTTTTTAPSATTTTATGSMSLTSSAFENNGPIPKQYACNGGGAIPPLAWTGVPVGTTSLALIVHDPDAPVAGGFTHWVVTGMPSVDGQLPPVPAGATQVIAWRPPCPPPGSSPHHYQFTLYAVSRPATTQAEIPDAAIAKVTLVGTYSR